MYKRQRWSARKSQIAKGEPVPEEAPLPLAEDGTALKVNDEVEDDEDAALTDAELLEKYELPDPEDVTEETGLDRFMSGGFCAPTNETKSRHRCHHLPACRDHSV
ncbi:MAG: DUF3306 domain-containing protein [Alphaproteobacteria bacterium]|nr:DUF3306 domain-containing protein [Alphaproteobacteria bacterium]